MLADEKSAANNSSRKPLKRFAQVDEKVMGSSSDSPGEVKPLKDDIFMLEKTDYSSGSSIHEDSDVHHRRQSYSQRNGSSSLVDSEHVVPGMRVSAQKVQHMNRALGPFQQQYVSRGNGMEGHGNRLSRSSRVQQYLDKAYNGSGTEMATSRTTSLAGSPHSRSSSSESSGHFEVAHEAHRTHASLHSNLNHRYNSPFSW